MVMNGKRGYQRGVAFVTGTKEIEVTLLNIDYGHGNQLGVHVKSSRPAEEQVAPSTSLIFFCHLFPFFSFFFSVLTCLKPTAYN